MKFTKPSKYKNNSLKSINLLNKTLIKFQSQGRRYKEARFRDTDTFDQFLPVLTIKRLQKKKSRIKIQARS